MTVLSVGAIEALYKGDKDDTPFQPLLQILKVAKIPSKDPKKPDRYRVLLSDGNHYQQAMLGSQLTSMVGKSLLNFCIVKLIDVIRNDHSGKVVLIILNLEVVSGPEDKQGSPLNVEQVLNPNYSGHSAAKSNASASSTVQNASVKMEKVKEKENVSIPKREPMESKSYGGGGVSTCSAGAGQNPQNYDGPDLGKEPIIDIKALNPYNVKWTIKARLIRKSGIIRWNKPTGSGQLFNFDLLDSSGGEIHVTGFNTCVDKFFNIFEVGRVYFLSNADCRVVSQKQFSTVKNDYEIFLKPESFVQPCSDDSKIAFVQYDFVPFDALSKNAKDSRIDAIGVLVEKGELFSVHVKRKNTDVSCRRLTLADMTSRSVELTLWGSIAEEFDAFSSTIVAVKGVLVGDFRGVSLSMISSSFLETNPDIPEAHQLRGWWDSQNGNVNLFPLSAQSENIGSAQIMSKIPSKNLADVKAEVINSSDKKLEFKCIGTVKWPFPREGETPRKLWYDSCPDCKKKVIQKDGDDVWECLRCDKQFNNFVPRYILSLQAVDHTGQLWLNSFDEAGKIILGIDATELMARMEKDPNAFKEVSSHSNFKRFLFRVRATMEEYREEEKLRCAIISVMPIDFVEQSKNLIELIERL